jgi:hypothetical protein
MTSGFEHTTRLAFSHNAAARVIEYYLTDHKNGPQKEKWRTSETSGLMVDRVLAERGDRAIYFAILCFDKPGAGELRETTYLNLPIEFHLPGKSRNRKSCS